MKVDTLLMDMPTNIQNATMAKELVLDTLLKNKVITPIQYKEYMDEWQIIVIKRSWYKRWWDKFSKGHEDAYIYKFVKFNDFSV